MTRVTRSSLSVRNGTRSPKSEKQSCAGSVDGSYRPLQDGWPSMRRIGASFAPSRPRLGLRTDADQLRGLDVAHQGGEHGSLHRVEPLRDSGHEVLQVFRLEHRQLVVRDPESLPLAADPAVSEG